MKKIEEMCKGLLKVYAKYSEEKFLEDYSFAHIRRWKEDAENHLRIIDWNKQYWINIKHDVNFSGTYVKINDNCRLSYFNNAIEDKEKWCWKFISRSDDWRQPKDEWLFAIYYSSWAYLFGDDYPTALFEEFFEELKSYNPKYLDTRNHSLYFWMDNFSKIFNEYNNVLQKYREKNKEDYKIRRKKKLEEQIKKLEQ